ncbi:MAG: cysteine desulfurase [Pseudomonadota bacterium]
MSAAADLTHDVRELEQQMRALRGDFPALHQSVNEHPLVFLDSAASSQRAQPVIDAVTHYETHDHANVHRGVHTLSHRATSAYEGARETVRDFIGAASINEIIFTRGTTEGINLVAQSFVAPRLKAGDEIVITHLEHHANIVPWQMLAATHDITLRVAPVNDDGSVDTNAVIELLNERTVMLAISAVSNALGTILPLGDIIPTARAAGIPVLVDGAQAVPHSHVDVVALDADFFVFSAHKMCGPTGVGVLYGREALLDAMPPWQGGGDMIREVSFAGTTYNDLPYKFEAGTPNISGVVGLGAACDYLSAVGMQRIADYEHWLLEQLTTRLQPMDDIRIVGTAPRKAAVVSFVMRDVHPHDLGTIVDQKGVAIRTGHHCAMPVMDRFDVPGTARASMAFYNTLEDIEALVAALDVVRRMFH